MTPLEEACSISLKRWVDSLPDNIEPYQFSKKNESSLQQNAWRQISFHNNKGNRTACSCNIDFCYGGNGNGNSVHKRVYN